PKPLQGLPHLAAGNAQADMLRRDAFNRVRFVEDHEVVPEQNTPFHFFVDASQQCEEKGMVQNQDIGGKNAMAGALKETDAVLLAEFGLITAKFWRTKAAFRTDLRPDVQIRFHFKVRAASVFGRFRPFVNSLK